MSQNQTIFSLVARYAAAPLFPWVRRRIADQMTHCERRFVPANIVRAARREHGIGGMLAADAMLFGICLIVAVALDLLPQLGFWPRVGVGMLCCCIAFDVWNDFGWRALLKIGFMALCAVIDGYWTLVVLFLIVFEHMTWKENAK